MPAWEVQSLGESTRDHVWPDDGRPGHYGERAQVKDVPGLSQQGSTSLGHKSRAKNGIQANWRHVD